MGRRSRSRPRRGEERRLHEDAAAGQPFGTAERRHEEKRTEKAMDRHFQNRILAQVPGEEPPKPDRDPFEERARKSARTAPAITDNKTPSDDTSLSALVRGPPIRRPTFRAQSGSGLKNARGLPVAVATASADLAPPPPRTQRPGSGILYTAQDFEARRKSAAAALRKTMESAGYHASMDDSVCPRCGSVRPVPPRAGAPEL